MALQFSTTLRNNRANQYESTIGTSPTLEVRTGAQPANAAAADSGTLLASLALPADWLQAASNGAVSINGSWQDISVNTSGVAAHFRIKTGATCHIQGSVSNVGGGGDMTITEGVNLIEGGTFTVQTFTLTEPGA